MRYRYLVDFRRGISVFAIFSYGIAVLGTPQCPPPHKPSSVSGGFIILCYFNHSTELHNVTILVMMTISIQLSL